MDIPKAAIARNTCTTLLSNAIMILTTGNLNTGVQSHSERQLRSDNTYFF